MTTSPLKGIDMGPTTGCGSNTTFSPLEVHPSCPRRRLTRAPPPEVTTAHPPRPAYPGRRLWSQRRVAGAGGRRGGGGEGAGGEGEEGVVEEARAGKKGEGCGSREECWREERRGEGGGGEEGIVAEPGVDARGEGGEAERWVDGQDACSGGGVGDWVS